MLQSGALIEAPNRDHLGGSLLVNCAGRLLRVPLAAPWLLLLDTKALPRGATLTMASARMGAGRSRADSGGRGWQSLCRANPPHPASGSAMLSDCRHQSSPHVRRPACSSFVRDRAKARRFGKAENGWCPKTDSNRRPPIYETGALPTELLGHCEPIYQRSALITRQQFRPARSW